MTPSPSRPPGRGHALALVVGLVLATVAAVAVVVLAAVAVDPPASTVTVAKPAKSAQPAKARGSVRLGGPGHALVKVTPAVARSEHVAAGASSERALRGAEPPRGTKLNRPPLASPTQRGCSTKLVANQSFRTAGVRPRLAVLHYTVSPRIRGRGDVDGIAVFFNRPAVQASSNYVLDDEGFCNLMVGESKKAWAQGNMNGQTACSFEVINTGRYATYIGGAGPGLSKLAMVLSDCLHRWGIPAQLGATSGCSVTRAGVVDHDELACGNSHTDIRPYSPSKVLAAVHRFRGSAASGGGCPTGAARVRAVQAALNRHGAQLDVDGIAGPRTRAAVAAFRKAHGLGTGNVAGPRTLKALGVC